MHHQSTTECLQPDPQPRCDDKGVTACHNLACLEHDMLSLELFCLLLVGRLFHKKHMVTRQVTY